MTLYGNDNRERQKLMDALRGGAQGALGMLAFAATVAFGIAFGVPLILGYRLLVLRFWAWLGILQCNG